MRTTVFLAPVLVLGAVLLPKGSTAQSIRIEAESGTLNGFDILQATFFSGGEATDATVPNPTATYAFSGWNGLYDISVGYCDEDDGTSSYVLSGSSAGTLASWVGDQPTGATNCNPTALLFREIASSVTLEHGEALTLECQRNGGELCRVDFLDFAYVGPMPPVGERAFPGAVGFGAFASGARGLGADVCVVTTLADSGPGSFRECAEQAAPAYITFAVSGYIDLSDDIAITGNKTVECATAPGDGVVFRRWRLSASGDNMIARGCRAWAGGGAGSAPLDAGDGIFVSNQAATVRHVILANNSTMFATDESIGTWYASENVTLQHNLAAWALWRRDENDDASAGFGILVGEDEATASVVENYQAFNRGRNPLVGPDPTTGLHMVTPVEIVNNLAYCYVYEAARVRESSSVHVIGNRFKACARTVMDREEIKLDHHAVAYPEDNTMADGALARIYVDGTSVASSSPLFTSMVVPVQSSEVESRVFGSAGPPRLLQLEIDAFEHYSSGTGDIIQSVEEIGGWPSVEAGVNPPDSDEDGMPDWWEEAHCSGSCPPTGDHDDDGYENIEEWFHSFYRARVPVDLEVDVSALGSDGNRVLEPGEQVDVAPSWRNRAALTVSVSGSASDFAGPAGATYTLVADNASYGSLGPGERGSCRDAGACYRMSVSDPAIRPAKHWHASFKEAVPGGQNKTWTLHIGDSFSDVPRSSPFYPAIEAMLHHGVTTGCGPTTYCPGGSVNRGQMAILIVKAEEGSAYLPPTCVAGDELFGDVLAGDPLCRWIEELARRGVVAGCGGVNYCPSSSVTRAQMAVFLLKMLEGGSYTAPMCSGLFIDVPCPSTFANWIEDLSGRGITGGCTATQYCPTASVNRDQMAVFLSKAFGLTLYGP